MSQENLQQLLNSAVQLARNGDKVGARAAFIQALKLDTHNETALIGLITVSSDPKERLAVLKKALLLHPNSPKVAEALRRLNLTPEQVMGEAPATPVEPPPAEPPAPRSIKRLTGETPAVTPEQAPAPRTLKRLTEVPDPNPLLRGTDSLPSTSDLTEGTPLDMAIARLNKAPNGDSGVPVPAINRLQIATQEANALANQFLNNRPESPFSWGKKDKNRAGERDRQVFRLQVIGATTATVFVLAIFSLVAALGNPDIQRLVFAPTWTVSPTATNTSTPTPGLTPTPSPTSRVTLTPSPTFPPQIPTRDPLVQPRSTDVNAPSGVLIEPQIEQVVSFLNDGRYDEAEALLNQEKEASELTGNFVPSFYLSDLYIRQGNLRQARLEIEQGEDLWQERSNNEAFQPMVDVAYARLELAEWQERGSTNEGVINDIDDRLANALTFDTKFTEVYLLLADRYLLTREPEEAIEWLDKGLEEDPLNVALRTKRAEVLFGQRRFDEALQTLHDALLLDPYAEKALQLQVQCAIGKDDPGLAVIYAEQYMARYPGRVLAIKLRGDAWLAEGKIDLALGEYTRALGGSEEEPAYIEVLLARANLYSQQGRTDLAKVDLGKALELRDDPRLRLARMEIAFDAKEYEVALDDAEQLEEVANIPQGDVLLVKATVGFERASSVEDVDEVILTLQQALNQTQQGDRRNQTYELLARAYLEKDDTANALDMINTAVNSNPTFARRLLRAQIAEQAAAKEDTAAVDQQRLLNIAIADYQWLRTFSNYYSAIDRTETDAALLRLEEALAGVEEG
jgi:tetratricopeptide (TPR) repeat protein